MVYALSVKAIKEAIFIKPICVVIAFLLYNPHRPPLLHQLMSLGSNKDAPRINWWFPAIKDTFGLCYAPVQFDCQCRHPQYNPEYKHSVVVIKEKIILCWLQWIFVLPNASFWSLMLSMVTLNVLSIHNQIFSPDTLA